VVRTTIAGVSIGILLGFFIYRFVSPVGVNGRSARPVRKTVDPKPAAQNITIELPVEAVWVFSIPPGKGVTRANADKITLGMTVKEISEILGGPPGDLTGLGRHFHVEWHGRIPTFHHGEFWMDDNGVVDAYFDKDGRLGESHFYPWARKRD
jgi:hypothetical protein